MADAADCSIAAACAAAVFISVMLCRAASGALPRTKALETLAGIPPQLR